MPTYTSTLPSEILKSLSEAAKELKIPKNRIIERALDLYLHEYKRAQYIESFKKANEDKDLMAIAEQGMSDYLSQLTSWDEAR